MTPDEAVAAARAWRDDDPDPGDRAEIDALLAVVEKGREAAEDVAHRGAEAVEALAELQDRFGARLRFGTAGLRGEMGAGPNRMNRAVVIRATAGLAAHLAATVHGGAPVIVGHDARHRSARFAADTAAVLAAAGFRVLLGDRPLPTPVVAFGVLHLGCCAGVVVTASHNPARDNGYKVYLGDGAQIASPVDAEISAHIDAVGPLPAVPRVSRDDPRIVLVGDDLVDAYLTAAVETAHASGRVATRSSGPATARSGPGEATPTTSPSGEARRPVGPDRGAGPPPAGPASPEGPGGGPGPTADVKVVYTPLHGVGGDVLVAAFGRAGLPSPHVVAEQAAPDPDFPTVAVPNPVEPGVLDAAVTVARRVGADLLLANDPDADRMAVAVPDRGSGEPGAWRPLTGDEIGVLLADWLLARSAGPDRLVVTTMVSSSMLARLATARGVAHAETLTGFKWIARAAFERPHLRFVYGYEEAMGSCVGTLVRDKDGITAALAFAQLAGDEAARGRTVADRLDDLTRELGAHVTDQRSVRVPGLDGLRRMRAALDRLVASPPPTLAGRPVTEVEDLRPGRRLPPSDGVLLRGDRVRLVVRPSGTEPKLKFYAEAVVPVPSGGTPAAARAEGGRAVAALLDEAAALVP